MPLHMTPGYFFNNQVATPKETSGVNFDRYQNDYHVTLKWNNSDNQNSQFTVTNILEKSFYSLYTIKS